MKATSGNNHLGGDDIDDLLIDYLAEGFKREFKIDLREDPVSLQRLKDAAEKAKIELSSSQQTEVNLPFIYSDSRGPKHLNIVITRSEFEKMIDPILEKLKGPTKAAMKDAKVTGKDLEEIILVGGSTRIPAVQKLVRDITGKEPNKSVHPDEAVALGAAIQAGILGGDVKDVLLLDVTPLTLGIETLGGIRTPIITRNTTIPTKKSQVFSTAADSQPAVTINVLQGEREMASDNRSLGNFTLEGIPPAPRGVPQIEVTFDIDANGIVHVSAKDKGTGKEQKIAVTGGSGLDKRDIEKMVQDAEKNAEEDKKKKEKINTKNNAENLVYSTEKLMDENSDKIDKETRDKIQKEIDELKEVIKTDDQDNIKKKLEKVNKVVYEIGMKMYQQTAQAESKNKKDDAVDAEVVDEEEEK